MRAGEWLIVGLAAGWWAGPARSQEAVITSFASNGTVAWTNVVDTNALYYVEWAASPTGTWHRSFDGLGTLLGGGTSYSVAVPMFYRVVKTTGAEAPRGMAWVDAGTFLQGQEGVYAATPVHNTFVGGFWMDEMEVSKANWDAVYAWATNHGYAFSNPGSGKARNHPVQTVDWYDCVKWCNARSQMENLTPCYYTTSGKTLVYSTGSMNISNECVLWSANGYRLPTEAEWEKAARFVWAGRRFPWSDLTVQHARANYTATSAYWDSSPTKGPHPDYDEGAVPYTSPVGSFPANGYGLHDMAGNVAEWVWDWYADYTADAQRDPQGPSAGTGRICRGGDCNSDGSALYCADRYNLIAPSTEDYLVGFRCVRRP